MNTRIFAAIIGFAGFAACAGTAEMTNAVASAKSAVAAVEEQHAAAANDAAQSKAEATKPAEAAKPAEQPKPPETPNAAEAPKPAENPKPAEVASTNSAPSSALLLSEGKLDEIDLEDDSAIAAKKPTVTGNLDDGMMSLVDIECDEATLADILRQFRKTTGANIISDDSTNLQKRVSVSLKRVPWLKGLTAILGSRGFRIEEHENIYRVVDVMMLF